MRKLMLASLGFLASGCAVPKLGITEVCFIQESNAKCYYPDGKVVEKDFKEIEKYTAFSVENASKINAYIGKCQKAGVKP